MTFQVDVAAQPSFWHDRNPWTPSPPLAGDRELDVVVLGGGLAGLSAAIHLVSSGLRVGLVEAGTLAGGATGRNAGFILEGVAESYSRTVELWGREKARRARAFTVANHELIRSLVAQHGIACEHETRGSLHLAATTQEAAELEEGTLLLQDDGFGAEGVPKAALPAWAQGAGYLCGQRILGDGALDPVALGHGLARAARRLGVEIWEGTAVDSVVDLGTGVLLQTRGGDLRASACVIATNAYGALLLPWLSGRIDPVRGQMLTLAPITQRLFDTPIYASHGFEYWRQLPTGEIVLGGWRNLDLDGEVGWDHVLNPEIQRAMSDFLARVHPALREVPCTHRWSGIMGFSRDSLPLVGALPGSTSVVLCCGFTGHGFGFAAHAGKVAADLLLEGANPWADLFAPRRMG